MTTNSSALIPSLRLWQLISPALPIGAYSYSSGLEYAVEAGWVSDEASAKEWILGQVENCFALLDLPIFLRLYEAFNRNDYASVIQWNAQLLACRETCELKQEDINLGTALLKVLGDHNLSVPEDVELPFSFAASFAFGCKAWDIDKEQGAMGLVWAWSENQVTAAIKLVPLGQTCGQRLLSEVIEIIPDVLSRAQKVQDDDIGFSAPGVVMASALHETQYSRLFRS